MMARRYWNRKTKYAQSTATHCQKPLLHVTGRHYRTLQSLINGAEVFTVVIIKIAVFWLWDTYNVPFCSFLLLAMTLLLPFLLGFHNYPPWNFPIKQSHFLNLHTTKLNMQAAWPFTSASVYKNMCIRTQKKTFLRAETSLQVQQLFRKQLIFMPITVSTAFLYPKLFNKFINLSRMSRSWSIFKATNAPVINTRNVYS
jgi:hypothetical protein